MAELERKIIVSNSEMRPCIINSKRAFFHRWADREEVILKINAFVPTQHAKELKKIYECDGYIPNGINTETVKRVVAIVEFEDGTVAEVLPENIRFVDSKKSKKEKAEFACRVCLEKARINNPNAIDCAWRALDNEYCEELKKIIEQEDTKQ